MSETKPNTDALTEILHKRAERKLRAKIEAMLPSVNYGHPLAKRVALPDNVKRSLERRHDDGKWWLPDLIDAAQEALYTAQVEDARAKEVAEFLAKVETTADELEAIREELHQ